MKSTIEELNAFVTINDSGSIVMAAQQLNQTTSGVSRALQRLETKLNVTLIERTTRKLKLTQEGQLFLLKARKVLADLAEAEESLLKLDEDTSGLIRVDSAISFILHMIVPLLPEFNRRYPHIQIELINHDQVIDLLEHKADVAIRFGKLNDSSLHAKLIYKSRLNLVASPDYLGKHGLPETTDELLEHSLLGFSEITHMNTWPIQVEGKALTIRPNIKASNGETIRELALNGMGIACLSIFMLEKDIADGRLVPILVDQMEAHEQLIHAVYYQQEHLPKRVRLFIEYLAEKLKEYL
ncbi:LysR family transcriptional regulator [Acinetobacter sp. ANC 5054]|uniref:LysR family transcriptional regulator n=1 Tax=Acinetobacter sp. ANC 5054 TaxID=1977877 RepID=UPI000A35A17C|nr:LysR family transcriptional regulator [Acinetobacter sp. ANC 5054]OTG77649.1 LysR family transcriptional regulator [Acinetobacter sp. ANC 5054]